MSKDDSPPCGRYRTFRQAFDLTDRVAVVTGGAGLLGMRHAEALLEVGATVVLADIATAALDSATESLRRQFPDQVILPQSCDVTSEPSVDALINEIRSRLGRLDILINNAANNPKMTTDAGQGQARLEEFSVSRWNDDLAVGLTGAFLCAKAAARMMIPARRGVLVNVASDMGVISPDQRVYLKPGQEYGEQEFKPVTYSAVKGGLISMTRWLATYLAPYNVRANTLTPASVYDGQDEHLVRNLAQRIPLGRMSHRDEFKAALLFLASDASSYMTGQNLVIDGGRTIW